MPGEYPDDADGDTLRSVAENGADMTLPMLIEFTIAVPTEAAARNLSERIALKGYFARLFVDDDGDVSIYCGRSMIATYEGVVEAQSELNQICQPYGAECDGWITAGNKQDH